jgi:hypothetical protein
MTPEEKGETMPEEIGPLALKALNGQIERAKELHAQVEGLNARLNDALRRPLPEDYRALEQKLDSVSRNARDTEERLRQQGDVIAKKLQVAEAEVERLKAHVQTIDAEARKKLRDANLQNSAFRKTLEDIASHGPEQFVAWGALGMATIVADAKRVLQGFTENRVADTCENSPEGGRCLRYCSEYQKDSRSHAPTCDYPEKRSCAFCSPEADCPAITSVDALTEYECTRTKDHDGDHVACGEWNHIMHSWKR